MPPHPELEFSDAMWMYTFTVRDPYDEREIHCEPPWAICPVCGANPGYLRFKPLGWEYVPCNSHCESLLENRIKYLGDGEQLERFLEAAWKEVHRGHATPTPPFCAKELIASATAEYKRELEMSRKYNGCDLFEKKPEAPTSPCTIKLYRTGDLYNDEEFWAPLKVSLPPNE